MSSLSMATATLSPTVEASSSRADPGRALARSSARAKACSYTTETSAAFLSSAGASWYESASRASQRAFLVHAGPRRRRLKARPRLTRWLATVRVRYLTQRDYVATGSASEREHTPVRPNEPVTTARGCGTGHDRR